VSQTPLALKRFPFVAMAMQEQTLLAAGNNNVFSMPWVRYTQSFQSVSLAFNFQKIFVTDKMTDITDLKPTLPGNFFANITTLRQNIFPMRT
jgi:hypothetical protein